MYVPNYIPEPIEVPGNVTIEPYIVRVRFVRRVAALHLLSLGLVALATIPSYPPERLSWVAAALVAVLLLLEVIRILTRGKPIEPRASVLILPTVLLLSGALSRESAHAFPVWALPLGPAFGLAYSLLCGIDFSFVGCYFLSLIASSVVIAVLVVEMKLGPHTATLALLGNAAYLLYWVYDLAALLSRRRVGEELAAVVDLYRDVFNFGGYIVRVIEHWKKHHIWVQR